MGTGLDRETLDQALAALREFAARRLTEAVLLDHDARDECRDSIVRDMCGPDLGIQLFFVAEEFNGMGGGAFDLYRICEQLAANDVGVATGVLATAAGSYPHAE